MAAGAWSGQVLQHATGDARWTDMFWPRRGHLLEVPRPTDMPPLRRGLMEGDYAKVLLHSAQMCDWPRELCRPCS